MFITEIAELTREAREHNALLDGLRALEKEIKETVRESARQGRTTAEFPFYDDVLVYHEIENTLRPLFPGFKVEAIPSGGKGHVIILNWEGTLCL